MIKEAYKYSELTSKIIGCSMEAHKILGNGFQEVIYQRALAIEMNLAEIEFSREFEMPIFYRKERIGTRRVDFLVEGVISVELKAKTKLEDVDLAQAINYLEAYNLEIGLLINFGETHGRDSDDIDKSITDIQITKQCFWLNKKLIQKILT